MLHYEIHRSTKDGSNYEFVSSFDSLDDAKDALREIARENNTEIVHVAPEEHSLANSPCWTIEELRDQTFLDEVRTDEWTYCIYEEYDEFDF